MDEANDVPLVDLHVVGADACPAAPSEPMYSGLARSTGIFES